MQVTVNGHAAYAYTGGKPFDPAKLRRGRAMNDVSVIDRFLEVFQ